MPSVQVLQCQFFQTTTPAATTIASTSYSQAFDAMLALVSIYAVHVQWRRLSGWTVRLYAPTPTEKTSFNNSALLAEINDTMREFYRGLLPSVFPLVCHSIFRQLCGALHWVLVFGRRGLDPFACVQILHQDVECLVHLFSREVDETKLKSSKEFKELMSVLELISVPDTQDLVQLYNMNKAPIPLLQLARLIAARPGKDVVKFLKTVPGART